VSYVSDGLKIYGPAVRTLEANPPAHAGDGVHHEADQRHDDEPDFQRHICLHRFGVDSRGLRLPGLISYVASPGGGTTDYAVDIFHQALHYAHYTCFLGPDTRLDMMYMPDAIRAMIELMAADPTQLRYRNAYNVTAMSVTPAEIAGEIRQRIPGFVIDYHVDSVRQAIADSWPRSLDDSAAREDWRWRPKFDLPAMTADMLARLRERITPVKAA
jgi:nucleoside-diphosphate-sugar epimerase